MMMMMKMMMKSIAWKPKHYVTDKARQEMMNTEDLTILDL